jgi:hexosaminidase
LVCSTYEFLTNLFAEVKTLFPDKYVHVGGDEVAFNCKCFHNLTSIIVLNVPDAGWEANPQIQQWMAEHPNITTYAELEVSQHHFLHKNNAITVL